MTDRIRMCTTVIAVAAGLALVGTMAHAAMTLTQVDAVDPENQPGLLRYEFEYTNDSETDLTFAITMNVALADGGGAPEGSGWQFKLVLGGESRPSFAYWSTTTPDKRVPPGGTLPGLFVLSRAQAGSARWGAVLGEIRSTRERESRQAGRVLGPVGLTRARQVVPPPLLGKGWNWISFPLIPRGETGGFDPADALGTEVTDLNLFRYHPVYKMFQVYRDDFTEVRVGTGYELWVRDGQLRPNYFGHGAPPDLEIPLVTTGWALVGHPRNEPIPLAIVAVRNETSGEVRTAVEDAGDPAPWLNWNWIYWDSVEHNAQMLRPDEQGDDFVLRPWLGYWVWANKPSLTLIIP